MMRREKTVEYAILGDVSGNVRIPGTDLVLFQLAAIGGRPQVAHLSRLATREMSFDPGTLTYTATGALPPAAGQAIFVQRTGGRAPSGWQVVGIAPTAGA